MKNQAKTEHYIKVEHTFSPIYDKESEILILGSFPSVKSRENQFYYGHPQNRFWKVLAEITNHTIPVTVEEKKQLLQKNHIALWDVIQSCSIIGSSDSSIRDVKVNDFSKIWKTANIKKIYANGTRAYELYKKYAFIQTKREIEKLPSTSPANAKYQMEQLCQEWKKMFQ
ncbi:MAG: DNA-deoxyinosine glycosylase [Lachnospiraceae bacterium]|nr:DNA-deoxyinosine glycosylase [Lachnospiraceae bacterium]